MSGGGLFYASWVWDVHPSHQLAVTVGPRMTQHQPTWPKIHFHIHTLCWICRWAPKTCILTLGGASKPPATNYSWTSRKSKWSNYNWTSREYKWSNNRCTSRKYKWTWLKRFCVLYSNGPCVDEFQWPHLVDYKAVRDFDVKTNL